MSLYKEYMDTVVEYVKTRGEDAFWKKYGKIEKDIYSKLLASHNNKIEGTVKELAEHYNTPVVLFVGFLDGINESLKQQIDIENITEDTEIHSEIDYEKLYFNMLDSKADYLYNLKQWDGIFSIEKRKQIRKQWRDSKTIVKPKKVGRNDPCPCGSGKKYKKCCGKAV